MARDEANAGVGYIDRHIGNRIRLRRLSLGIDQQTLGSALGLTARQVQDYEGGATRVGATRLSAMAEALDVPILFFFGGLEPNTTQAPPEDQRPHERYGFGSTP